MYQYYDREQDVEGSLTIQTSDDGSEMVTSGACPDFFEFRMVNRIIDKYIHMVLLYTACCSYVINFLWPIVL